MFREISDDHAKVLSGSTAVWNVTGSALVLSLTLSNSNPSYARDKTTPGRSKILTTRNKTIQSLRIQESTSFLIQDGWTSATVDWSLQRHLKEKVEPRDEIGVVYQIVTIFTSVRPVERLTSSVFTAQVTRKMQTEADHSAAADRVLLEGHKMGFDNPGVLDRDKRLISRRVKEALWLYSTDEKMNRDQGLEPFKIWFSVL